MLLLESGAFFKVFTIPPPPSESEFFLLTIYYFRPFKQHIGKAKQTSAGNLHGSADLNRNPGVVYSKKKHIKYMHIYHSAVCSYGWK